MRNTIRNPKGILITITIITLICKILGFLKNSVLAYYYGTSNVVDAYVMTFSIGTITASWIAGLIGNFTPKFKEIEAIRGKKHALSFAGQVFRFVLLLTILLVIVLEIIAPTIVELVAPGFKDTTYYLTIHFFRIYCVSIVFYAIFRFSQEFLNCNQNHLAAIAPDLLMSLFCIIAIVISSIIGADYLIFGYVIAILMQGILTFYSSRKMGLRVCSRGFWNKDIQGLLIMALPIFLSDALSNINNLVDKIFASGLSSGIVASLDYANTMKDFAYQVGTIAISTTFFPIISKLWADGNTQEFKERIINNLNIFSLLYIPLLFGIVALGDIVIKIVFQRGAFTSEASTITTNVFIIYSINLLPMAYRLVFHKAFFATQKTKYVLAISFINVVLNIILNLILVEKFDYIGLAMATTASSVICMPFNFWLFSRSIGHLDYKSVYITASKCLIAAIVMYGGIVLARKGLVAVIPNSTLAEVVLVLVMFFWGALIYYVICSLLKVSALMQVVSGIYKNGNS